MTSTEHLNLRILYKIASRGRPDNLRRTIENVLIDTYPKQVLVSVDHDDQDWKNMERILRCCSNLKIGASKNKVEAINRDIPLYGWDILVNISDDQFFIDDRFGIIIRSRMANKFPDLDGVLHFPDDNRADLMTMSIIGHQYYLRDKYVYHPSYHGQFCDDEAQNVAIKRGRYAFCEDRIFNHLHPNYHSDKVKRDKGYLRYDLLVHQDEANHKERAANNYYL